MKVHYRENHHAKIYRYPKLEQQVMVEDVPRSHLNSKSVPKIVELEIIIKITPQQKKAKIRRERLEYLGAIYTSTIPVLLGKFYSALQSKIELCESAKIFDCPLVHSWANLSE